jgi:hypothetical protein
MENVHELADAVREAVRLASAEIVEEDELDFTEAAPVARVAVAEGEPPTSQGERAAVVVRHRSDRRTSAERADAEAQRVVTLRDRRRGRPRSRSSGDPPR